MQATNAAVTSPRRSGGASSFNSCCALMKARPWPAPAASEPSASNASECAGNAATSSPRPIASTAQPEGLRRPARRNERPRRDLRRAGRDDRQRGDGRQQRDVLRVEQVDPHRSARPRGTARERRPDNAGGHGHADERCEQLARRARAWCATARACPSPAPATGAPAPLPRRSSLSARGDTTVAAVPRPLHEHARERREPRRPARLREPGEERGTAAVVRRVELRRAPRSQRR